MLNYILSNLTYIKICIKESVLNIQKVIKTNQEFIQEVGVDLTSISENSIFDDLLNIYENYDAFGKFCIGILFFNYLIASSLISIVFIFFGEFLIKRFDLENKYPKLAKIIALRRKFQRYYLILNVIYIAFAVIVETVACLYILSL